MSAWWMWTKQLCGTVAFCLPVMITFDDLVGFIGKVDGCSMEPTLNPDKHGHNDLVWVKRWNVWKKALMPGVIIALKSPTDPGSMLIKRVVALEGNTIYTRDSKTCLTIPHGYIWIEGENMNQSRDSNFFGPVSLGLVLGQATHIVWPPYRWRQLEIKLTAEQMERRPPAS